MADILKHLDLNSADGTQLNLDALYQIAPSAFTEVCDDKTGEISRKVNFEVLRQLLGDNATDSDGEMYQFTWVGKNAARAEAAKPTDKTLRPVPEDSVDWDNTKNIYIEGDNLEVLKLLQRSYMGKVKMIYIDPPYNTGNDFVYHDDFARTAAEEDLEAGNVDELGNRFRKNTDTNGKFHSDWCSMIYTRLLVARSLLTEDGVIFISIDEHEYNNLRNLCNEIFSASNCLGTLVLQTATDNNPGQIKIEHEYILCYVKTKEGLGNWAVKSDAAKLIQTQYEELKEKYNDDIDSIQKELRKWIKENKEILKGVTHYDNVDTKGVFHDGDIANTVFGGYMYDIIHPVTGRVCKRPEKGFRFPEKTMETMLANDEVMFGDDETTLPKPKIRLTDAKELLRSVIYEDGRSSTKSFEQLMARDIFQNPKSETIINRLIKFVCSDNDLVLDFFSGSATTAEACFLAKDSDCDVRFILVQIQENLDETYPSATSKAKKTMENAMKFLDSIGKPHTIPEIGKERIRRSGDKVRTNIKGEIKTLDIRIDKMKNAQPSFTAQMFSISDQMEMKEQAWKDEGLPLVEKREALQNKLDKLDTGFRVYRLDESNYENVSISPKEYKQDQLDLFANNIKRDRTDLDLLYGAMLAWGVRLDLPLQTETVDGCTIYTVNEGDLVACFSESITDTVIKTMADKSPLRILFRDACFKEDAQKINIYEQFKQVLDWADNDAFNNIRVI